MIPYGFDVKFSTFDFTDGKIGMQMQVDAINYAPVGPVASVLLDTKGAKSLIRQIEAVLPLLKD